MIQTNTPRMDAACGGTPAPEQENENTMPKGFFSPAKERREKENALLDRDGFPPCAMTLEQFSHHCRELFADPSYRIVAFRVRAYGAGGTLTTRRGEMHGIRANKVQVAACKKSVRFSSKTKAAIAAMDAVP